MSESAVAEMVGHPGDTVLNTVSQILTDLLDQVSKEILEECQNDSVDAATEVHPSRQPACRDMEKDVASSSVSVTTDYEQQHSLSENRKKRLMDQEHDEATGRETKKTKADNVSQSHEAGAPTITIESEDLKSSAVIGDAFSRAGDASSCVAPAFAPADVVGTPSIRSFWNDPTILVEYTYISFSVSLKTRLLLANVRYRVKCSIDIHHTRSHADDVQETILAAQLCRGSACSLLRIKEKHAGGRTLLVMLYDFNIFTFLSSHLRRFGVDEHAVFRSLNLCHHFAMLDELVFSTRSWGAYSRIAMQFYEQIALALAQRGSSHKGEIEYIVSESASAVDLYFLSHMCNVKKVYPDVEHHLDSVIKNYLLRLSTHYSDIISEPDSIAAEQQKIEASSHD
eukprot:g4039.t1